jgi:hypothetical protein
MDRIRVAGMDSSGVGRVAFNAFTGGWDVIHGGRLGIQTFIGVRRRMRPD